MLFIAACNFYRHILNAVFFSSSLIFSSKIMDTLQADGLEALSFLDYLAYIPLFLDIHDTIVVNPLEDSRSR